MSRATHFRRPGRIPRRVAVLGIKTVALGLPLILASSLQAGAEVSGDPRQPAQVATPSAQPVWPPVRGDLLADEVPPKHLPTAADDLQVLVLGGPVAGTQLSSSTPSPSGTALTQGLTSSGIPVRVLRAYVTAAQVMAGREPACKIDWSLLAGIGRVESNHARFGGSGVTASGQVVPPIYGILLDGSGGLPVIHDTDGGRLDGNARFDRAVGPMQFLPGTWKGYGADGNADGVADPQNVDDAALAAARYLCAGGGDLSTRTGRWNAVYRYNHSSSYVALVLALADSYASGHATAVGSPPPGVQQPTDQPASVSPPPATTPATTDASPSASPTTGAPATTTGSPTATPPTTTGPPPTATPPTTTDSPPTATPPTTTDSPPTSPSATTPGPPTSSAETSSLSPSSQSGATSTPGATSTTASVTRTATSMRAF